MFVVPLKIELVFVVVPKPILFPKVGVPPNMGVVLLFDLPNIDVLFEELNPPLNELLLCTPNVCFPNTLLAGVLLAKLN